MPPKTRGNQGASKDVPLEEETTVSSDTKNESSVDLPPLPTDETDPVLVKLVKYISPLYDQMRSISSTVSSIKKSVENVETKLEERVTSLETKVGSLETSLDSYSESLTTLKTETLPELSDYVASVHDNLADYVLSIDAHRRKWNVVFHGIKGDMKEEETETRRKTKEFAQNFLKLSKEDAENTSMSACHRLSNKKDAGVIVRFTDLSQRDQWLAGTKNLKDTAGTQKISVAIDLPPVIRPLKDELMMKRSKMERALKLRTKLKYLTKFPYVELRAEGAAPIRPSTQLREVTKTVLGMDPAYKMPAG